MIKIFKKDRRDKLDLDAYLESLGCQEITEEMQKISPYKEAHDDAMKVMRGEDKKCQV